MAANVRTLEEFMHLRALCRLFRRHSVPALHDHVEIADGVELNGSLIGLLFTQTR